MPGRSSPPNSNHKYNKENKMSHIHCTNRETGDFIAHIDNFGTTYGVVVREGRMVETVKIHTIEIYVDGSYSSLDIHTDPAEQSFIRYKLTPLATLKAEDIDVADRCARKFIHQHYLH